MASDTSASSCDISERDDQLSISSEEEEVQAVHSRKSEEEEVQEVEFRKRRMKKVPARYRDGLDTRKDKLEVELKGSKFASITSWHARC